MAMCLKPFKQGIAEYGCGQCMPCRINRRRLWTARLMLEQTQHQVSSFVTLTYNDESLPAFGSLVPDDLQNYMKKLRKLIYPRKVRFYGVGEYGDRSGRPHYHILLFGPVDRKEIVAAWGLQGEVLIDTEMEFKSHSSRGIVHVGSVTNDSISYVVSYVCKRMTRRDDPRLGEKCHPEFARMSLKPGLGAGAIHAFIQSLNSRHGANYIVQNRALPPGFRLAGKIWPFGRYLGGKIREELGFVKPKKFDRSEPLDLRMLERQVELRAPGGVAAREGRRIAGGLKAEFYQKLYNQRKVL